MPTPTPNPNLLDVRNGTVLRSYSPALLDDMNDGNLGNAADGIGAELPGAAKPPYVFTFELAGVATITSLEAALRGTDAGAPAASVAFAVSTTGPTSGFTDVATVTGAEASKKPVSVNVRARWVRVTANQLFDSVSAEGSLAPPPSKLDPTGTFIEDAVPDKNGAFVESGRREEDERVRFVAVGPDLTATECNENSMHAIYVGTFDGRSWAATNSGNSNSNPEKIRGVVNDEGTIIAGRTGDGDGASVVFMRTTQAPPFCKPRVTGTGAHHYLVLDQVPPGTFYPADAEPPVPNYTFSAIGAGMLDASALAGQEGVITRDVCKLPQLLGSQQIALLLQWTAAGHKLLLAGGSCSNGSDFTWLPYPFTSAGPGPESTHASLIQVENNALGTNDKNDAAHFVDVPAYVNDPNVRLPSASLVTTTDPHWCGHFFIAKTTNLNGFVQTYAVDGGGELIYDGFNGDDGLAPLQRIRRLELDLNVPADLPCSQRVTEAFLLEPSQEATFAAGTAQKVHAEMQLLANQGWNGHVNVKAAGDLSATVTPGAFDIAGGVQHLDIDVDVPASTKPGAYTVTVSADDGAGATAQASIVLTGTASLAAMKKSSIQKHQRIRIYGIHFDYDSAHIQPRSEPVIADIAALMKANPSWTFEVSGHTDSDGGAAYNLALSQRRAQSVVNDLVTRYHIARSRLVAKGYGLTRPVASNNTDAGKALNRRVELERLQ